MRLPIHATRPLLLTRSPYKRLHRRPYIHLPLALILVVAMLFEYVIRPLLRPIKELTTDFTVFRCGLLSLLISCAYSPATATAPTLSKPVCGHACNRHPLARSHKSRLSHATHTGCAS